jgi:simple sugar transport system permease protein
MNIFYNVVQSTMFFTMPLLIVALAGMFSERSGIVNIALEGKMVIGAFTGTFFIHHFQGTFGGQPLLIAALFLGMLAGMLVSLLHAYAAINLKANQIISGVAINMFAPAFAVYTSRMVIDHQNVAFNNAQFRIDSVPLFGSIPLIGPMFFQRVFITTLLGFIILIISAFVIYKTKFGLRLRACGEHPQAADSVGVSVSKIRYAGVLISGALAGIGGIVFIVPISNEFVNGSVSGYGFLALAVLIFGAWRPMKILFGALFFGLMQAISANFSVIPFLSGLNLHANFFRMLPFIATLIVLAFTSKNSQAPRASGQPYDKGGR